MSDSKDIENAIEAALFSSERPLSIRELQILFSEKGDVFIRVPSGRGVVKVPVWIGTASTLPTAIETPMVPNNYMLTFFSEMPSTSV